MSDIGRRFLGYLSSLPGGHTDDCGLLGSRIPEPLHVIAEPVLSPRDILFYKENTKRVDRILKIVDRIYASALKRDPTSDRASLMLWAIERASQHVQRKIK